ncbi:MAG: hypothetical protein U0805_01305 [Pirellulales bacterium]
MSDAVLQHIPIADQHRRVESGAVQLGEDWPGLFLRGDDAIRLMYHIRSLEKLFARADDWFERQACHELVSLSKMIERNVVGGRERE